MSQVTSIRKIKKIVDNLDKEVTASYIHSQIGVSFHSLKDMLQLLADLKLINYRQEGRLLLVSRRVSK